MPTLSWKGTTYTIEAMTLGDSKAVARLRKEYATADEERQCEIIGEMLGLLHCPQELGEADAVALVDLFPLVTALQVAQSPTTGGGGTGENARPTEGVGETS